MHNVDIPASVVERKIRRHGTEHPFADLDPERTALVVIDLQNGFMMHGVGHAVCDMAVEVVPNVNRLASALRETGGKVFWIQNTHDEACLESWSVLNSYTSPEQTAKRIESMSEGTKGHALWDGLDVRAEDEAVKKYRFSAFLQGSSDLPERLRAQGYDTVLIVGTVTNVCCDSSARDAMMLNFKTIMVSDGCAATNDEEHNAALIAFYLTFGDVMTTDELIACLQANARARKAS